MISNILGLEKRIGPLYGVECEIEGRDLPEAPEGFRREEDGSLRNGYEYVFVDPVSKARSLRLLRTLYRSLERPDFSFRTSTHVHVNVSDKTYEQVMCAIYGFMLTEDLFVNFCAKHRQGNRFALRFKEAEALIDTFLMLIEGRGTELGKLNALRNINQNTTKYSALNMYTLLKYGTLEFRSLEGHADLRKMTLWLTAIDNWLKVCTAFSDLSELHDVFFNDPEAFIDAIFPPEFKFPGWKAKVEESYSQSFVVVSKWKWGE